MTKEKEIKQPITKKEVEVKTTEKAVDVLEKTVVKKEAKKMAVGKALAQFREAKKISREDVAKNLCIRLVYIEAIESLKYEDLPEHPYGAGFIKAYANYLGLDGAEVIEAFNNEISSELDVLKKSKENKKVQEIEVDTTTPNKQYVITSVVAIIVISIIWVMVNAYSHNKKEVLTVSKDNNASEFSLTVEEVNPLEDEIYSDIADTEESDGLNIEGSLSDDGMVSEVSFTSDSVVDTTVEQVLEVPVVEEVKLPTIKGFGVEVVIKGETWFEIKDGERLLVSKVMQRGDYYKIPNRKGLVISTGRVEEIDVYVDGVLTEVFKPYKKMNISIDEVLENRH